MDTPLLLLLLSTAVVGCIAGALWSRRQSPVKTAQEVTVVFIPALIIDLAFRLAKQNRPLPLLRSAAEWLHDDYHVPAVVLYPFDPATSELRGPIVAGPEIIGLPQRIRLGVGIYGEVARNQRSQFVENVARERRLGPTAAGVKSAYILPLMYETSLIGVLGLQSRIPETLKDTERAIFDQIGVLIADLAGAAFRLEHSQQAIMRFDRFQLVAQRLTERLDSQQLLQEIVEAAREMLEAQAGILLDIDSNQTDLRPIAWAGIPPEIAERIRSRYKEDLKGMVAWARQPARTPDLHTDQRSALGSHANALGMVSELAVPVLYFDKLFGVLAVQTDTHRAFTDEEVNLLSSLAAHAGIALRNAQLFESLQKVNRDLETSVADLTISRQQAENARVAAVEANRLKTEFVNNMNHELRTPLNAIINFTRIVKDGYAGTVNEQQVQYLAYVHDSGQHLLGLINDILDLAKIEAGKMELRPEPTDLEPILRGVMSTAVGLTRDKSLQLNTEIEPDLPRLNIDGTRIRQVLLNLLSNAAKFTVEGGITLQAMRRNSHVVISVKDTGIGIKPEDLPKVFEEFRQVDGSLQRTETGTGLGMPISQRFVQLHGGEMWIDSQVDVGTTVSFSLPVEEVRQES